MGPIGDGRRDHFGLERIGEEQELLALVAGDVAEDAAVARALEEPGRALVVADSVGAEAGGVDDLADGAGLDQFARLHRAARFVVLGIEHGEDAAGLGLHVPERAQFVERDHARLVGHHVLAMPHGGSGNFGAVAGDGRSQYQRDGRVLENFAAVGDPLRLGVLVAEGFRQIVFHGVEGDELGPLAQQAIDLAVDVTVVDADGGEFDGHGRSGVVVGSSAKGN